jgi:hypothetical protein
MNPGLIIWFAAVILWAVAVLSVLLPILVVWP